MHVCLSMRVRVTRLGSTGAGSANLGAAMLLSREAGVPLSQIFMTNSRGLMWRSEDGETGYPCSVNAICAAVVGIDRHFGLS